MRLNPAHRTGEPDLLGSGCEEHELGVRERGVRRQRAGGLDQDREPGRVVHRARRRVAVWIERRGEQRDGRQDRERDGRRGGQRAGSTPGRE